MKKEPKPFTVTINNQTHMMEYVSFIENHGMTYHIIECIPACCSYATRIMLPELAADDIIPRLDDR